jgi:hypothetical protein
MPDDVDCAQHHSELLRSPIAFDFRSGMTATFMTDLLDASKEPGAHVLSTKHLAWPRERSFLVA